MWGLNFCGIHDMILWHPTWGGPSGTAGGGHSDKSASRPITSQERANAEALRDMHALGATALGAAMLVTRTLQAALSVSSPHPDWIMDRGPGDATFRSTSTTPLPSRDPPSETNSADGASSDSGLDEPADPRGDAVERNHLSSVTYAAMGLTDTFSHLGPGRDGLPSFPAQTPGGVTQREGTGAIRPAKNFHTRPPALEPNLRHAVASHIPRRGASDPSHDAQQDADPDPTAVAAAAAGMQGGTLAGTGTKEERVHLMERANVRARWVQASISQHFQQSAEAGLTISCSTLKTTTHAADSQAAIQTETMPGSTPGNA